MDLRTKREVVQVLRRHGRQDLAKILANDDEGLVVKLDHIASSLVASGEYIRGLARKTTEQQDLIQKVRQEIQNVIKTVKTANNILENI